MRRRTQRAAAFGRELEAPRKTRALLAATCSKKTPDIVPNISKTPTFQDRIYDFRIYNFPFGHAPASTASDGTQARGEIASTMNWRIGGLPLEGTPPLA